MKLSNKYHKKCGVCKKIKPAEDFWIEKASNDGLRSWCKQCVLEYNKKYYQKNKEKIKTNVLKWNNEH